MSGRAILRMIRKEPALITGGIASVIGVLIEFGVLNWSIDQIGVVMIAEGALMLMVRSLVTPTVK